MSSSRSHEWVDLAPAWDRLVATATARHDQKRAFASSRYWTVDSHLVGLCGEYVYATVAGLPMDETLRVEGDGGVDFRLPSGVRVNVKTSTCVEDPHLKLSPHERQTADAYVLVVVDVPRRRGRYCGWTPAPGLMAAPLRDYGHGPRHALPVADLWSGLVGVVWWGAEDSPAP